MVVLVQVVLLQPAAVVQPSAVPLLAAEVGLAVVLRRVVALPLAPMLEPPIHSAQALDKVVVVVVVVCIVAVDIQRRLVQVGVLEGLVEAVHIALVLVQVLTVPVVHGMESVQAELVAAAELLAQVPGLALPLFLPRHHQKSHHRLHP